MPPSSILFSFCFVNVVISVASVSVGVNWGSQTSHPLNPDIVVKLLKDNGITKIKLFDADPWTLSALSGTGIDVMVGIPNDRLSSMSRHYDDAKDWVKVNVIKHLRNGDLKIRYVAVGNEPFLTSYKGAFNDFAYPALQNIQKALDEAGVGSRIKAVLPHNADVYDSMSGAPSGGAFRSDIRTIMTQIARFLQSNGAPFVVNIYPFLSLQQNTHFPVNFAFFDDNGKSITDGGREYTNVFDANFDTLLFALKNIGITDMKIIVGEVGWPTDGCENANVSTAKHFYDGFLKKMASNKGTPMRPGPLDVYLFGLIDEDAKSILPGTFERHWGLFTYDGRPKFEMDLSGNGKNRLLVGAKGVEYLPSQWCKMKEVAISMSLMPGNMDYACSLADCSPLAYGGSCNHLSDPLGKASYAFNIYFQMQDQDVRACDFQGLAEITTKNMSRNGCLFPVQIANEGRRVNAGLGVIMVAGMVMSLLGL